MVREQREKRAKLAKRKLERLEKLKSGERAPYRFMDAMRLPSGKSRRNLNEIAKGTTIEVETVPAEDDLLLAADEYRKLLNKYTEEAEQILNS